MGGGLRRSSVLLLALSLGAGCASEGSEAVEMELRRIEAEAGDGVAKIHRALHDPSFSSPELGEGARIVAGASRALAQLEVDERANDIQQLMSIVYQARAWDDVALAYASALPPADLAPEQRSLLVALLDEKALPARMSAAASYQRARERACRSGLDPLPVMNEILDGIERYAGRGQVSLDSPCAGL